MVSDVEPYELMKLRLLNAGHQALGYFGYLLGHRLVHEAAQDPPLAAFVRRYMDEEGTPTLQPVPGVDLDGYKDTLLERFANPYVRDQVQRLCLEGSDRIPKFVLPVVREQLAYERPVRLTAAIVASGARYCEGLDERGQPSEIVDNIADDLAKDDAVQAAVILRGHETLLAANRRSGSISIVDTAAGLVTAELPVGKQLSALAAVRDLRHHPPLGWLPPSIRCARYCEISRDSLTLARNAEDQG
jgi:mannitol-1-phosphate/altronate dehydrogenase